MVADEHSRVICNVCNCEMQSNHFQRHMQRADHQPSYPTRSDSLKIHEKKYGEGLRTVNDQMKWGYGLKSKHDKGVGCSGDESETDSDSDTDAESETDSMDDEDDTDDTVEDGCEEVDEGLNKGGNDDDIGRYVWRWNEKNNNNSSRL